MAFEGLFIIGDGDTATEIINTTRTEAYAENAGLNWFTPGYESALIPALLGDAPYQTPQIDDAPWYDPDNPVSNEFLGFYPSSIDGLEDSTRQTDVVESTEDGGIPGRLRYATKTAVFTGVLIATSSRGAEYGFRWLARATARARCTPGRPNFNGETLHYLATDPSQQPDCTDWVMATQYVADGGSPGISVDTPVIDGGSPATTGTLVFDGGSPGLTGGYTFTPIFPFVAPEPYSPALSTYWRFLRRFKITVGPKLLAKRDTSDGGSVWQVQMTGVAGTPFEFGDPIPVLAGFNDPLHIANPYAPGVTPGVFNQVGQAHTDIACSTPIWTPVYDPFCSPVVDPPSVPDIGDACYTPRTSWWRRFAQIDQSFVPLWGDVVPVISIHTPVDDLSMFRIRFFRDIAGTGDADLEPCDFIGDMIVTYSPQDTTLIIDGVAEAVYVQDDGGNQRRADSLVVQTDGAPFEWPKLTCGYGYIVTFDQPTSGTTKPWVDLALVPRATA